MDCRCYFSFATLHHHCVQECIGHRHFVYARLAVCYVETTRIHVFPLSLDVFIYLLQYQILLQIEERT